MAKKPIKKIAVTNKKAAPKQKEKLDALTQWRIKMIDKGLESRKMGRPVAFETPEDFAKLAKEYFKDLYRISGKYSMPTKAGLLIQLGISRETYNDYKKKPEFSDTIKGVEKFIELSWNERLSAPVQASGAIFYLKNAFGYKDQIHTKNEDLIKVDIDDKQYSKIVKYIRGGKIGGGKNTGE